MRQVPPPPGGLYDPLADAAEFGLRVHKAPLTSAHSVWIPDAQAIVIAHTLGEVGTRYAVAHQVMHAALESMCEAMGTSLEGGPEKRYELEVTVCGTTARRMLPIEQLDYALRQTDSAEQVADIMQVPTAVLARRVWEMTPAEHDAVDDLTRRLYWPDVMEQGICGRVHLGELTPPAVILDIIGHDPDGKRRIGA